VNDAHPFLGTRLDNQRDMALKGRHGTQRVFRKDFDTILHLRSVGVSTSQIAKIYGVTYATIWWILQDDARRKRVA
jgi:hypothetical protein